MRKNLPRTGIRSPDPGARSELLYKLNSSTSKPKTIRFLLCFCSVKVQLVKPMKLLTPSYPFFFLIFYQNPLWISILFSHHLNIVWRWKQIKKLVFIIFSLSSYLFSPLSSKYSLRNVSSNTLSCCSCPVVTDRLTSVQNNTQTYRFCSLDVLGYQMGRQSVLNRMTARNPWIWPVSSFIPATLSVSVLPKYLNFATISNALLRIFVLWFCPHFVDEMYTSF